MVEDLSWSWTNAGLGFTLLALLTGLASMLPAWTLRMFGIKAAASGPKPVVINVPAPSGALHTNASLYSDPH